MAVKRSMGVLCVAAVAALTAALPATSQAGFSPASGVRQCRTLTGDTHVNARQLSTDPFAVLSGTTTASAHASATPGYTPVDNDDPPVAANMHPLLLLPGDAAEQGARSPWYGASQADDDHAAPGTWTGATLPAGDRIFERGEVDPAAAQVTGTAIPLPAALGPGLIGLAAVALVKRLGRRILA